MKEMEKRIGETFGMLDRLTAAGVLGWAREARRSAMVEMVDGLRSLSAAHDLQDVAGVVSALDGLEAGALRLAREYDEAMTSPRPTSVGSVALQ